MTPEEIKKVIAHTMFFVRTHKMPGSYPNLVIYDYVIQKLKDDGLVTDCKES